MSVAIGGRGTREEKRKKQRQQRIGGLKNEVKTGKSKRARLKEKIFRLQGSQTKLRRVWTGKLGWAGEASLMIT